MINILRSKAKASRKWLERIVTLDSDIDRDMTGLCLRASFRLASRLQASGVKANVKVANVCDGEFQHAYVVAGDYILDITCTQFGGPKVKVAHKTRANKNMPAEWDYIYSSGRPVTYKSFKNPKRINKRFKRDGWGGAYVPQPKDFI